MSWLLLLMAIGLELCGTTCMKLADGMKRPGPAVLMVLFYLGSLSLMSVALKKIELNVAYAVWSGLGTTLVVAVGILFFHEPTSPAKLASIALIVLGVLGLRLAG
jgi:small multidrug resistance pump